MYKTFLLFLQFAIVFSYEYEASDTVFIGNLKEREQIPLQHINRRQFSNNLNYRKTKEIRMRSLFPNKRFEVSEAINNIFNENIDEDAARDENLRQLSEQLQWHTISNYE